jgi:MinD-like ATPase involved in chromosome partitioning or flagellar assembly
MGKLNLFILDGDTRYMDNLSGYISGHYRHRFNLQTFTGRELFLESIQHKDARADILLITADENGGWLSRIESGVVIILTRGDGGNAREYADGGKNIFQVDRYGGADKLVIEILKIYDATGRYQADTGDINGGRESKIITVAAADGGAGKTTVAVALCSHYVKLKLKTLYISLDYLESGYFNTESGRGGLSDVIYTIKTRPEKLGLKLEASGKQAPGYGFFYLEPPLYPMDIDEITPQDIETLIARLRGAGIYDRVVIDTHNGMSMRNKTLFELTDRILLLASGDPAGQRKLYMLKEQIDKCFDGQAADLYKRCHIVLNRVENPETSAAASAEITGVFSAGVSVAPFNETLKNGITPGILSGMFGGFGAAIAEIAHRA